MCTSCHPECLVRIPPAVYRVQRDKVQNESFGNWTVLLKFPSNTTALDFINSEAYAPLKDLRINELTTGNQIILLPTKIGL